MEKLIITLKVLLFISLSYLIYIAIKHITDSKVFSKSANKLFNVAEYKYKARKDEYEQLRKDEGNTEENSFIYQLDLMIERSGLRKKINLNTDIYLLMTVVLSFIAFIVFSKLSGVWLLGVLAFMLIIITSYALLYILSGIAYEKVEKQIVPFINILENYSGTNDDIVSILGKTYPYLESPLRDYIEEFYNEVSFNGDITGAFRKIEAKVENERFKEIMRNLEICSRHEANYQEIIKDSRSTLMDYIKAKEERKEIIKQGRVEILMSLVLSCIMLVMFTGFVPNLVGMLVNSAIGNGILLYSILVLGICLWTFIAFDKKE